MSPDTESNGTDPVIAEATLRSMVLSKENASNWSVDFPKVQLRIDPELMDPENPDVVDRVRKSLQLQLSGRATVAYLMAGEAHRIGCVIDCHDHAYLLSQKERELKKNGLNPEGKDSFIRILDGFEDEATKAFEKILTLYFGEGQKQSEFESWVNQGHANFQKFDPPFENVFGKWVSIIRALQDCRNRFFGETILKRAAAGKMATKQSANDYLNEMHFTFAALIRELKEIAGIPE